MNVGFDFDMTLVDSSQGIFESVKQVLSELVPRESILHVDLSETVGLPLDRLFDSLVPSEFRQPAIDRYLQIYPDVGIRNSILYRGAKDIIETCESLNYRTVLISAKTPTNLELMLDWHRLSFNRVYGGAHGREKGRHLKNELVDIYIGDQEADVEASLFAGAISVIIRNEYNTDLDAWGHKPDLIFNNLIEAKSYIQAFNLLV